MELLHFALVFVISLEFWNSEFFLSLGGIRIVIASEFYSHELRVTLHSTIHKSFNEQYDHIFLYLHREILPCFILVNMA